MALKKRQPGDPMVFPAIQNQAFMRGLGKGGKGQRRYGFYGNKVDPTTYHRSSWETSFYSDGTPSAPTSGAGFHVDFRELTDKQLKSASNSAIRRVDDKLRVLDSYFEDWYERKQAYSLLASSAKSLLELLLNYKKKSYWVGKKADHSALGTIPELWLTYQFGIVPLVGSIARTMDVMGADFPVVNASGTGSFSVSQKYNTTLVPAQFRRYGGDKVFATSSGFLKYGCRITGVNPNSALAGATGLNEPFSSAWAVIPWGWAVDYFFNASELVSNLENKHPGITVDGWYRSLSYETNIVCASKGQPWDQWGAFSHQGREKIFYRDPWVAPTYEPELSVPLLGTNQAANLLSAIALTLKGKH